MENYAQMFDCEIKQEPSTSAESDQDIFDLEIKQEILHLEDDDQEVGERDHEIETDQETITDFDKNSNIEHCQETEECTEVLNSETGQKNIITVNNEDMVNVIIKKKNSKTQREIIFLKENPIVKAKTRKKSKFQTFEMDQIKKEEEINRAMQDHTYYLSVPKPERIRRDPTYFGDFEKEDLKDEHKAKIFLKVANDLYKKQLETIRQLSYRYCKLRKDVNVLEAVLQTEFDKQRKSETPILRSQKMKLKSQRRRGKV